jgi:hypothetical protein
MSVNLQPQRKVISDKCSLLSLKMNEIVLFFLVFAYALFFPGADGSFFPSIQLPRGFPLNTKRNHFHLSNSCKLFRGGSSDKDKIKGRCIGIDLGTTYRLFLLGVFAFVTLVA